MLPWPAPSVHVYIHTHTHTHTALCQARTHVTHRHTQTPVTHLNPKHQTTRRQTRRHTLATGKAHVAHMSRTHTLVARAGGNLVVDEVVEGDDGADER